ncbi:MAG: nucleotidyl transferase AbiEii/AbiGii toxin family protein [Candidatus Aminicenantales bacterium]
MLDLKQIESFYPDFLKPFKENLLREYLQYKILEIVFDSKYGNKLVFMGGTAIHIFHSNTRFSEDLDFDNLDLKKEEFEKLGNLISQKLKFQGYKVETKLVLKKAYRLNIKIPELLYENKLSSNRKEKIHIQIDAEPQDFSYKAEQIILNKFDVFLRIPVVPVDILLSQKLFCIFARRRPLGRDFYDALFLLGKTRPNLRYLKEKLGIKDYSHLKSRLLRKSKSIDFAQLARDVEPFLFSPSDSKKVLLFPEYIKGYEF